MTIKVGDKLPEATFKVMKDGKPADMTVSELTKGKKVALFAVPGAFTPTCSAKHLPSFIKHAEDLKAKGVECVFGCRPVAFVEEGGSHIGPYFGQRPGICKAFKDTYGMPGMQQGLIVAIPLVFQKCCALMVRQPDIEWAAWCD